MERILIVGCPGAGKTTFARQLGEKLGLDITHLDKIFWSPGNWEHLDTFAFDKALLYELSKPRWIIEGNYDRTIKMRLKYCDTVIWLDYRRYVCMGRWFKRILFNLGKVRSDMAEGCFERFEWDFAGYIWNFNRDNRSKYETLFGAQKDKVVYRFRTSRQAKEFLQSICKPPSHW